MALNVYLKYAVSRGSQTLFQRNSLFETPLIFGCSDVFLRGKKHWMVKPVTMKYPIWHLKKERVVFNENLTRDNDAFIKDIIHDKYGPPAIIAGIPTFQSPLKIEPVKKAEISKISRRTGLIAKKIGEYPLWSKNGNKIRTTLVQISDNHVVKYIPPEEFNPPKPLHLDENKKTLGCLVIGAESGDPSLYTKEYCGLFKKSGVPPKKILFRFVITPDAAITPGTPLSAAHYKPGEFLDVRGNTIDRGFQGVMKRWGFKGMPATHGVTKSHRRGGCIAGGAGRARVHLGKKMPGHMGNRWRTMRGVEILRINTKYNVLWLKGSHIPGEVGSYCYLYDSILPTKKREKVKKGVPPPYFPTYVPEQDEALPEDLYHKDLHNFSEPTIVFGKDK